MPNDINVADSFKGLPIGELIASPLRSACDSEIQLAAAEFEFMTKIGFEDGDPSKGANLLKFNLQRPVETPNGITTNTVAVQAPFLGLVPVPSLLIETVNIDFQMEVTATESCKDTKSGEATVNAAYKSFLSPVSVDIQGKIATSRENTRSTDQTAKYQVHVAARQQPPTEGLSRLMDIMASCTAPLSITSSKN